MGLELLIGAMLGFVILGPRRMHSMLGNAARAKVQFDKVTRELKSQLSAELERLQGSGGPKEPALAADDARAGSGPG